MRRPQLLILAPRRRIIVNRIPIVRISPVRKICRKLPERIGGDTRPRQRGRLPLRQVLIPQRRRRRRVFLQHDGLAGGFADGVVLRDPGAAPGVVVPPRVRVHVEGAVVDRLDGEVLDEVDAFVAAVRVGAVAAGVAWLQPAFVAEGHHVVCVEGLDIGGDGRCPGGDHRGGTAGAAGFVAELPAEYVGGTFVPGDDEFDVVLVRGLAFGVSVERSVRSSIGVDVSIDTAQGIEVIQQWQDKLDSVCFCR